MEKDSCNFVISFNTGAFELLREAIGSIIYTVEGRNSRQLEHDKDKDSEGNIVSELYTIKNWAVVAKSSKHAKLNGSCTVRIHIYRTTSRCLINGRDAATFVDIATPTLGLLQSTHTSEQNERIKQCLTTTTHQHEDNTADLAIMESQRGAENNDTQEKPKCMVCCKNVLSRAATCDTCEYTVHYRCDKLSNVEIDEIITTGTYTCKSCQVHTDILQADMPTAPNHDTAPGTTGTIAPLRLTDAPTNLQKGPTVLPNTAVPPSTHVQAPAPQHVNQSAQAPATCNLQANLHRPLHSL